MCRAASAACRDKPLRGALRKQSRYAPSTRPHATTKAKRVSINPETRLFVFTSTSTPDLFFEDPSTAASLTSAADPEPLQDRPPARANVPPPATVNWLTSTSGIVAAAADASCTAPPAMSSASFDAGAAAEGSRQARLLEEIENLSISELKDKIREVWALQAAPPTPAAYWHRLIVGDSAVLPRLRSIAHPCTETTGRCQSCFSACSLGTAARAGDDETAAAAAAPACGTRAANAVGDV